MQKTEDQLLPKKFITRTYAMWKRYEIMTFISGSDESETKIFKFFGP